MLCVVVLYVLWRRRAGICAVRACLCVLWPLCEPWRVCCRGGAAATRAMIERAGRADIGGWTASWGCGICQAVKICVSTVACAPGGENRGFVFVSVSCTTTKHITNNKTHTCIIHTASPLADALTTERAARAAYLS